MKVGAPNVRTILSAVYAFEVMDRSAWLAGVADAAQRSLPDATLAHAALLRWRGEAPPDFVAFSTSAMATPDARKASSDPALTRAILAMGTVGLAGPLLERGHLGGLPSLVRDGAMPALPRDIFFMQAASDDSAGAILGAYFAERADPLEPGVRALWVDVAAHLAAAARLRLAGLPRASATMSESFRVLDAHGAAQSKGARAALRTAARAVDEVRGRQVTDPEEALSIWRVLTERRWTIADEFDGHGRRTIVAYENVPLPTLPLPSLTLRERQVVCFVALGHTNKQIGYELELSASSVATHLTKAMKKLGVRSRAGLAQRLMQPPP